MPMYRVREGQSLNSGGRMYRSGETIELEESLANSCRGKLDRLNAAGKVVSRRPPDISKVTSDVNRARPHERVTILERAIAETEAKLVSLKKELANAKVETEPAPAKPEATKEPAAEPTLIIHDAVDRKGA